MCEEKFRTYSSYEDIDEVCEIFDYIYTCNRFVEEKEFILNEHVNMTLRDDFGDLRNFVNEFVICECFIRPILAEVARENEILLWSHIKFEYNKKMGLSGEPDYFLASSIMENGRKFGTPVVCLGEAKKDNFDRGWGQVSAEMIAAQKLNNNEDVPIYGLVSTGRSWQFGVLKNKTFTIDSNFYSAPGQLDEVLNILNWMFCEARKNADTLEELKNNKNK